MKYKHQTKKHHEKKHLMGRDQLHRHERMALLQSSENSHTSVKPHLEATNKTTTETNGTTRHASPIATSFEEKKTHPNPLEKFVTQCKRISEQLHHLLKHLF